MENILEVKNLRVSFRTNNGTVKAVRDISFNLEKGKTLAIVGESGSGKSVTSKVILGISAGNAIIESGEVIFDSKDIIKLHEEEMYNIRGDKIAMVFQDPLSSLNPIVRIGTQITEAMLLKDKEKRKINKKNFNSLLSSLKKSSLKNYIEDKNKQKEISELFKKFNQFNIISNSLASSFELSKNKASDVKNKIDDFLFVASKNARQNIKMKIKNILSLTSKIKDPFLTSEKERNELLTTSKNLKLLLSSYKQPSGKKVVVPENIISSIKELYQLVLPLIKKETPNFFDYGNYLLDHPKEELLDFHFNNPEINKIISEQVKNGFMKDFILYGKEASTLANNEILEKKKEAVNIIKEIEKYYQNNDDFDKKEAYIHIKNIKNASSNSINVLASDNEKILSTYSSSLISAIKKYFKSKQNNEKDKRRFEKQSAKYEKVKQKGKKVSWKVAPLNQIDLLGVKNDIISCFTRLIHSYNSLIKKAENFDSDKNINLIITKFKESSAIFVAKLTKSEAKERAIKLMEEVGIPEARTRFRQYPFEFSGGMRQRIVIAIALSASPEILICDEPTTALDVTIQAQILELINKIKKERNLSIIFITHDLGVVANMADDIAIMYAGKIIEKGTSEDIFYHPAHPYTWALLSSVPDLDTKDKLEAIPGTPPNMIYPPVGDAFAPRNKYALDIDYKKEPPMFKISNTHYAATWLLHPKAPKVEMPDIIKKRIKKMSQKGIYGTK